MSSSSTRRAKRTGHSWHPGGFAGIPRVVLETGDFLQLSHPAKVVLFCLAYQFRGKNNGDISMPHSLAKQWGIGSKTTLTKALRELEAVNLILKTRDGRFLNPGGSCSLYAVTWQPINECNGKLDVAPTIKPIRQFTLERSINRKPSTVNRSSEYS